MSAPQIFISYRREDTLAVTGRIYDKLAARLGAENVFMDFDTIPLGVDFRQHLNRSLQDCNVLLVVIGPDWIGNVAGANETRLSDPADFVRLEVQVALERDISVIPVLVGRTSMPTEDQLPSELQPLLYRQAASVDLGRDFHVHMERLIAGIERVGSEHRSDVGVTTPSPSHQDESQTTAEEADKQGTSKYQTVQRYLQVVASTTVSRQILLLVSCGVIGFGVVVLVLYEQSLYPQSGETVIVPLTPATGQPNDQETPQSIASTTEDQESGRIQGTVLDEGTGNPMVGVNVVVLSEARGATTNTRGQFTLSSVQPGGYRLSATFQGYHRNHKEVKVEPGQIATVNFTMRKK